MILHSEGHEFTAWSARELICKSQIRDRDFVPITGCIDDTA